MKINFSVTGLDPLKQKAKQAAKDLYNMPVPLGKSVILTTVLITGAQILLLRKYNLSFVIAKKA